MVYFLILYFLRTVFVILRYLILVLIIVLSNDGYLILSIVFLKSVKLPKSMNSIGMFSFDYGQSLVPAPPHRIIGLIFI